MIVKSIMFFLYLIFAGYVLWGEIGLNRYGTKQGALNRIDTEQRAEIDSLMRSDVVASNIKIYQVRMGTIDENSGSMNMKNVSAVNIRGASVKLYDDKVIGNDKRIDSIQKEFQKYVASLTDSVKKGYDKKRAEMDKESNVISLGVIMPCAALFLCLFSAWVLPANIPFKKNYGLIGSYIAQIISCILMFDAVVIQQGVYYKAVFFSTGASICIPLGHHLAGLLWRQVQWEWANRNNKDVIQQVTAPMPSITMVKTTTTTTEHKLTMDQIPDNFSEAINMIASEKRMGNGVGLQSLAAQKFSKSEAWISQCVKKRLKALN